MKTLKQINRINSLEKVCEDLDEVINANQTLRRMIDEASKKVYEDVNEVISENSTPFNSEIVDSEYESQRDLDDERFNSAIKEGSISPEEIEMMNEEEKQEYLACG